MFNPFSTNFPFLEPQKASENLRFSDDFRGYRSGTLVENRLKHRRKGAFRVPKLFEIFKVISVFDFVGLKICLSND